MYSVTVCLNSIEPDSSQETYEDAHSEMCSALLLRDVGENFDGADALIAEFCHQDGW